MADHYIHCGWEPDESGDTYARGGEHKSIIFIYVADEDGHPDDEVACIVHRHMRPLQEDDPAVREKLAMADLIVDLLNRHADTTTHTNKDNSP